jgi:hypothetical protein
MKQNISSKKFNINSNCKDAIEIMSDKTKPRDKLLCFNLATEKEVSEIIRSLKPKKSAGWDELSPFLLKRSANFIVNPLTYLINQSLKEGIFPDLLKYAIVKPVPKKSNMNTADNLRPISLLPTFSKVFERVVFNRLYTHLERNEILSPSQFGFRRGKCTADAIYELVDTVSSALDGSRFAVGAFCDLSKAFDCVDLGILVEKLRFYGVESTALAWLKSFLTDRVQKVVVGGCAESSYEPILSGVPQGSILGPLLFLVYCNDLPKVASNVKLLMYADDTSIVASGINRMDLVLSLNDNLSLIDKWFKANGLKLNPNKTQFLNFHLNNSNTLQADSSFLPADFNVVVSTRFLGLEVDSSLTWCHHINSLLPKLSKAFYALLILSQSVTSQILRQVYFAYFHSIISYGLIFWGNSCEARRVFLVQKRVIRLLSGTRPREPRKRHFQKLGILPLSSL